MAPRVQNRRKKKKKEAEAIPLEAVFVLLAPHPHFTNGEMKSRMHGGVGEGEVQLWTYAGAQVLIYSWELFKKPNEGVPG